MKPTLPDSFRKLPALVIAGWLLGALTSGRAQSVAPAYLFTHLAGPLGGPGNIDGPAAIARFQTPTGVAVDAAGNVYVADDDNHSIRKITPAGVVSTVPAVDGNGTPVSFFSAAAVAVDPTGNIFVADDSKDLIYRITPAGLGSIYAGATYTHYYNGNTQTGDGTDGTGTAARFFRPSGLATDTAGNLYVADSGNHTIRKIAPGAVVTTLAGTAGQAGSADGTGPAARLANPASVAVDAAGNVYVGDAVATIRKITPDGIVTTLAGTYAQPGSADGTGAAARFYRPRVASDGAGNLYVADAENHTIRQVTPAGVVTTFAGAAGQAGDADGTGSAARFSMLSGLALDGAGNIYVADQGTFTIRKITPGAVVSTFAAVTGGFGTADGTGVAARFNFPQGVTVEGNGNLYVADFYNHTIRKITPAGAVTTLAGTPGQTGGANGTGAAARFYYPSGVAVDGNGNIYVAEAGNNSIRKVTTDGVATLFAGPGGGLIFGHTDGPGADARFAYPEGIAVDAAGTVYVADSGNSIIRKITPAGVVSTLAGTAVQPGSVDGTGANARFNSPLAVAADDAGNVFVADTHNHTIRKITAAGVVTTLAGAAGQFGYADGTGANARFNNPCGVAVDRSGNVFVGDANNLAIRRITPDGTVSTVGGKYFVIGGADGLGAAANFYYPSSIAVDRDGTLYIADEFNHAIRKGQPAGPPVITTQPLDQTVVPGGTVQFSVTASSALAATYQWYLNGSSFSGATSATLSFTNARTSDAGDYSVVVTNQLGSALSRKATLTVAATPVPPPTTPPISSGGGGAVEPGLVLALLALGAARAFAAHRETRNRG